VKEVAVSVPTFKLKEEMAPPIKVFVVIELVWMEAVDRGAIILTVLAKMTSFTKEMGENPKIEDTVSDFTSIDPDDRVFVAIELVVARDAIKIPTCSEREEMFLLMMELVANV